MITAMTLPLITTRVCLTPVQVSTLNFCFRIFSRPTREDKNDKTSNSYERMIDVTDENDKVNTESEENTPSVSVPTSKVFSFLKMVKQGNLSTQERLIHMTHVEALQRGDEIYTDPQTRYLVLTRLAHLRRGECCGNACRHCPFRQRGVPADQQKKRYNSAFFV